MIEKKKISAKTLFVAIVYTHVLITTQYFVYFFFIYFFYFEYSEKETKFES